MKNYNIGIFSKTFILILLVLGLMNSCRVDMGPRIEELKKSMSPQEILFYKEYDIANISASSMLQISHLAAKSGYLATIELLQTRGFPINSADKNGYTALMYAAEAGHLPVVRFLVEKAGSDVRVRTEHRISALMLAIQNKHILVCKYLLDRGANANAKTLAGVTPLMHAAASGSLELVKLLIERGAAVDMSDNSGLGALDYASTPEVQSHLASLSQAKKVSN